jgi:hypothetical protein
MSPNSKDRLIYIVTGGVFIPLSYVIALCLLSLLVSPYTSPLWTWLATPVLWPLYIDGFLNVTFGDSPSGLFILLIPVGNFALYCLLTYAMIRWRHRMRLR